MEKYLALQATVPCQREKWCEKACQRCNDCKKETRTWDSCWSACDECNKCHIRDKRGNNFYAPPYNYQVPGLMASSPVQDFHISDTYKCSCDYCRKKYI